jgi:hypothetical protein
MGVQQTDILIVLIIPGVAFSKYDYLTLAKRTFLKIYQWYSYCTKHLKVKLYERGKTVYLDICPMQLPSHFQMPMPPAHQKPLIR